MLEKLDNNEAILLMYLADELPCEDRAEIERMLAKDISLRSQLAVTRSAQSLTERVLHGLDAAGASGGRSPLEPGTAAEAAALRRIHRSMHAHLTRKRVNQPASPAKKGLLFPWWVYPTSAIAATIMAALVWWGYNVNDSSMWIPADQATVVGRTMTPYPNDRNPFWLPDDNSAQDQQINQISQQEKELASLTNGGDDDSAVWKISSDGENQ